MKQFALFIAILATLGVWIADLLLLSVPAFRNGWWTLTFFAFPAALLAVGWGGEENQKLRIGAVAFFALSLVGWVGWRLVDNIGGTPAVAVGDRAPNFTLKDQNGKNVSLSDYTGDGRVLLIFFRGKWCPVCRGALRGLLGREADFKTSRVTIMAVGPQTPEQAKEFELPFPVLSDPDLAVTKQYGLVHPGGMLGKDVPRPTALIIDENRKIQWLRAETSVRVRPAPDEIFEQLRK